MAACPDCGTDNPDGAKFCSECGAALESVRVAPGEETRKTVTILFCDVTGSTELGEQLDPESLRKIMGRYFDEVMMSADRPDRHECCLFDVMRHAHRSHLHLR